MTLIQDTEWIGGSLTRKKPIFSDNGNILLVPMEDQVQLFYTRNGALASSLSSRQARQHLSLNNLRQEWRVSSISIDYRFHNRLYVAYENGCIVLWDYESGIPITNLTVSFSPSITLLNIFTNQLFPEYLFVFWKKNTMYQLSVINTENFGKNNNTIMLIPNLPGKPPKTLIIVSINANHSNTITCCYASETKLIFYHFDRNSLTLIAFKHHIHTTTITSIAYNNIRTCVAIGDISGRITLLYLDQTDHQKIDIYLSLHWHAHAINALSFSNDGKYLLSGGAESVLVVWNLSDNTNQFLPRLGGPITHISLPINISDADLLYSVSIQHKNSISIIRPSSDLKEYCSIQGCLMPKRYSCSFNSYNPLTIQDSSSPDPHLILCQSDAIQFYRASQSFTIKVIPQNLVSDTESNTHHMNVMIQYVAFTRDGQWMMISEWNSYHSRLRFWKLDTVNYHQVGMVEYPHNYNRVTGICFHPNGFDSDYQAASIGEDGKIRTWRSTRDDKRYWWSNSNQCSFRSSNDTCPVSIQFSEDGSLILVLYLCKDAFVTLWDSKTLTLMQTLCLTINVPKDINDMPIARFIPNTPSILVTNGNGMTLWTLDSTATKCSTISLPKVSNCHPTRLIVACHPSVPNIVAASFFYSEQNKSVVLIWDIGSSNIHAGGNDQWIVPIAWYCHDGNENNTIQQLSFVGKGYLSLIIVDGSGCIKNLGWNNSIDAISMAHKLRINAKEKRSVPKSKRIDNIHGYADALHHMIDDMPSHILPTPEQLFSLALTNSETDAPDTEYSDKNVPMPILQKDLLKQQFIDMILTS